MSRLKITKGLTIVNTGALMFLMLTQVGVEQQAAGDIFVLLFFAGYLSMFSEPLGDTLELLVKSARERYSEVRE